jgi:hypothetical protein
MSIISLKSRFELGGHTKRSSDSIISDHQLDAGFREGGDVLKRRLLFAMSPEADPSSSPVMVRTDPFASRSIAASYPLAVSCTPSARSDNISTASCKLGAEAGYQLGSWNPR